MQLVNVGVAMGNVGGFIEVRNKSSHNCDLYGYAGIQLLDAQGRPLPTTALWSTDSYIHGHVNEIVVGLPAGTAGLTSDRQVPGHGYIPLSWSDVQKPCSVASKLRVIPPDAFQAIVISVSQPVGSSGWFDFCANGTVIVSPATVATVG